MFLDELYSKILSEADVKDDNETEPNTDGDSTDNDLDGEAEDTENNPMNQDLDSSSDGDMDSMDDSGESNNDNSVDRNKKISLFDDYEKLLNISEDLLDLLTSKSDNKVNDNVIIAIKKLSKKLRFVIEFSFQTESYNNLLRIFLYLQHELNVIKKII